MILADVMEELGDALDTIAGLRVYRYPTGQVQTPAAVVTFPEEITFDGTYARGMDEITIPIVVAIDLAYDRTTVGKLSGYVSGSGTASVKAVVEGYGSYTALDSVRVASVEFEPYTIGGQEHLAAIFMAEVIGPGTTA